MQTRIAQRCAVGVKLQTWDRLGFDVGSELAQGMSSTSSLVKPLETK